MTAWCALRMANRHTLTLADALTVNGFNAWTPAHSVRVQKGNSRREVRQPLMASFVFAHASHVNDLTAHDLDLPPFSFFRPFGEIEFIPDHELEPLREAEKNGYVMAREQYWRKGDKVFVTGGIFGGMNGIVERGHKDTPTVRFGSRMRVQISSCLLQDFKADNGKSARSARRACSR